MNIRFPKPIPRITSFTKWLNNWLESCIASQPKSTDDIIVDTAKDGSRLYLADRWKNQNGMNYLINDNYASLNDETPAQQQARINALTASYGTDAPIWTAASTGSYTRGTIVRVLQTTVHDPISKFVGASWSGSTISGSISGSNLTCPAGVYICVQNIPASSSAALYNFVTASGGDLTTVRNPAICYAPLFPEPVVNARYFGATVKSGSVFEKYQGRYWECIGLFSTGSSSGGMSFKGQWATTASYKAQNVVVLSSGSNAGSYIAVVDINGTGSAYAPDVGSPYWVQLGSLNTIGKWT